MNQAKHTLTAIGQMTLIWTIAWFVYATSRYMGLEEEFPRIADSGLQSRIWQAIIPGLVFGSIFGLVSVIFNTRAIRRKPFAIIVAVKFVVFLAACYLALGSMIVPGLTKSSGGERILEVIPILADQTGTASFISFLIFSSVVSLIISVGQQIIQFHGQGFTWKLATGKYYRPRTENRIFMFLDLSDSTAIAEKLGHQLYSAFLQQCFYDVGSLANKYGAAVYQYVGDEMVLSWKDNEVTDRLECIRLFFHVNKVLNGQSKKFIQNYGIVPHFKAAVHCGAVSVAEVGYKKKEIAYHGDAVNTTARMQKQCSILSHSLIVSNDFIKQIPKPCEFDFQDLGLIPLKGKESSVQLYSVIPGSDIGLNPRKVEVQ